MEKVKNLNYRTQVLKCKLTYKQTDMVEKFTRIVNNVLQLYSHMLNHYKPCTGERHYLMVKPSKHDLMHCGTVSQITDGCHQKWKAMHDTINNLESDVCSLQHKIFPMKGSLHVKKREFSQIFAWQTHCYAFDFLILNLLFQIR